MLGEIKCRGRTTVGEERPFKSVRTTVGLNYKRPEEWATVVRGQFVVFGYI